jgi:hypothetical protein
VLGLDQIQNVRLNSAGEGRRAAAFGFLPGGISGHQSVIALTQKSKDLHADIASGNRPAISDSYRYSRGLPAAPR